MFLLTYLLCLSQRTSTISVWPFDIHFPPASFWHWTMAYVFGASPLESSGRPWHVKLISYLYCESPDVSTDVVQSAVNKQRDFTTQARTHITYKIYQKLKRYSANTRPVSQKKSRLLLFFRQLRQRLTIFHDFSLLSSERISGWA